jgi:hypothetical protein
MADEQTNQTLCAILEMLRDLQVYSCRQHNWIAALAAVIEQNAELGPQLKRHPLYDQGQAPFLRRVDAMTQNIDALIRQLKGES